MANTDKIYIGGLLRCCIGSVREAPPGKQGDSAACQFHDTDEPAAFFHDGAWRWAGTPGLKEQMAEVPE